MRGCDRRKLYNAPSCSLPSFLSYLSGRKVFCDSSFTHLWIYCQLVQKGERERLYQTFPYSTTPPFPQRGKNSNIKVPSSSSLIPRSFYSLKIAPSSSVVTSSFTRSVYCAAVVVYPSRGDKKPRETEGRRERHAINQLIYSSPS